MCAGIYHADLVVMEKKSGTRTYESNGGIGGAWQAMRATVLWKSSANIFSRPLSRPTSNALKSHEGHLLGDLSTWVVRNNKEKFAHDNLEK